MLFRIPLAMLLSVMAIGSAEDPYPSLEKLLTEKRYLELESALPKAKGLTPWKRTFLKGVLANRQNRIAQSLRLLKETLQKSDDTLTRYQEKVVLTALADGYTKAFRYRDAFDTYTKLLEKQPSDLSEYERSSITGDKQAVELLRDVLPQTIKIDGDFILLATRNTIQTIEAPIEIDGHRESWILDTGANISVLSRTTAQRFGLKLSSGTAPVAGFSGRSSQAHLAAIPILHIGKAEIHNVAVLVMEDADLYIAPVKFQFRAILGYPVLSALGRITFRSDGQFQVSTKRADSSGGRMYMEGLTPLVETKTNGSSMLCRLDTGASNSYLTVRYFEDHRAEFAGKTLFPREMGGSGGTQSIPSYILKNLEIEIGDSRITLPEVPVHTQSHDKGKEYFLGHFGQDVISALGGYTTDFRTMKFSIATR